MRLVRPLAALAAVTLFAMSCEPARSPVEPAISEDFATKPPTGTFPAPGNGVPAAEIGEICKYGSSASFHYTVTDRTTGASTTSTITVADGDCEVLVAAGGMGVRVSITEDPSSGYQLDSVIHQSLDSTGVTTTVVPGTPNPTIVDSATGSVKNSSGQKILGVHGFEAKFYNHTTQGQIGDFVWNDLNGNGIQDAGEPGIGGITVTLSGTVNAMTTTNGSGGYVFTNLPAGSYTVTLATPAGFTVAPSTAGTDTTIDSNGSPASVTLPSGTSTNLTIDFGFVPIPGPQLKVEKSPKAGSFTQNGQASFTIKVSNPSTGSPATNVTLNDALPGNGGLVWQNVNTSQGTCSITSNQLVCSLGTIAAGGMVTVNVSSTATTPLEACTTQDNPAAIATADDGLTAQDNGSLSCTPAPPQLAVQKSPDNGVFNINQQVSFTIVVRNPGSGLAANNVQLNDALPGNGGLVWQSASSTQGSCGVVSNALSCSLGSIAAGASVTVTVTSTATTPNAACTDQPNPVALATADGGLSAQDAGSLTCTPPAPTGQIGDFVWNDLNDNGIQDAGEPGIPGLTVTLSGTVSGTTVTNASGGYLFSGLPAGSYTVTVGTPGGFVPSPTGQGTTATDNNGSPASVSLPTNSSSDLTIDIGFAKIPNPTTVTLCKQGTSANFTVVVNGQSTGYNYAPGQCRVVDTHNGLTAAHTDVINEQVISGTVFDSIIWTPVFQNGTTGSPTKVTGTTQVTVTANDLQGAFVTYFNHTLPIGGQGCTPGYWKQTQHFDSWPSAIHPNTLFGSVFENAFPGMTMVQVLAQGGGGLNALGRMIVSALLNSYTMNYNLTTSQVIQQFNAIFPASTKTGYDAFEQQLDTWNNQSCVLN